MRDLSQYVTETFIVRHFDANRKLLHAFAKKTDGSWAMIGLKIFDRSRQKSMRYAVYSAISAI